jgi:hypothetical protein
LASTLAKRPLPALVALLALLLLTSLVWWRVMHRGGGSTASAACPSPTASAKATLPAPARITVTVLNATKRTGIAARARTTLVSSGFQVPSPAANDSPKAKVLGTAEIRYGASAKPGATLLRYYFPGARLVPTASKTSVIVVSLGAKYRAVASAPAVQAALKKDNVEVATAASASSQPSTPASC